MNRAVPDEIVEVVRDRCDIVELISSYLPLKRNGNTWKACCPFHQEKTPSFHVNPQRQRFHCFGCGKGGDVFRFVMEHESVDFPTAIHMLASRCGVVIPEQTHGDAREAGEARERHNLKERLYKLHEEITEFFVETLWKNPDSQVHRYFLSRGIPAEVAKKFRIGAAPEGWQTGMDWCQARGFSAEELESGGIVISSEKSPGRFYDRFRNRLVFPIWNEQGKVVAFSARTVEAESDGAKYVNSPETAIFRKSHVLYALPHARKAMERKKGAILCEGQLDTIAMHQSGFDNAVAPQGTAFTYEQARILSRYTDKILLCFDSDSAGIKAALRAFEILLPLDFEVKVISLPGGKDPDELLKKEGADAVAAAVESAADFFDFLCRQKQQEHDLSSPAGKSRMVDDCIKLLQKIGNSVIRSQYASKLAMRLGVNEQSIFQEMNKFRKQEKYARLSRPSLAPLQLQEDTAATEGRQIKVSLPPLIGHAEESLLKMALVNEDVAKRLAAELPVEQISETPMGQAIDEVIRLTMEGEWAAAAAHLNDWERGNPDPDLGRVLSETVEYDSKLFQKATDDCIKSIVDYYRVKAREEVMLKLRACTEAEERKRLMQELIRVTEG